MIWPSCIVSLVEFPGSMHLNDRFFFICDSFKGSLQEYTREASTAILQLHAAYPHSLWKTSTGRVCVQKGCRPEPFT